MCFVYILLLICPQLLTREIAKYMWFTNAPWASCGFLVRLDDLKSQLTTLPCENVLPSVAVVLNTGSTITGSSLKVRGRTWLDFYVGNMVYSAEFVFAKLPQSVGFDGVLGWPFLRTHPNVFMSSLPSVDNSSCCALYDAVDIPVAEDALAYTYIISIHPQRHLPCCVKVWSFIFSADSS